MSLMETDHNPSQDTGVRITFWLSLYGTLLGALLLLACAGVLLFGLSHTLPWTIGAPGILLLGTGRAADHLLNTKLCDICDEPMLWGQQRRKSVNLGDVLGLPLVKAVHRGAMTGLLKCLSCGDEDGRRGETIHFAQ
ncbi:hypothetical protein [Vitreimonas flagellata]|uniref:hypothetical protein n=1 Tax=Vitreimonas flagellata TaxID=2560861 RepID=UPI001074C621|nr:hypothetical protein [Vitreimonas flagellata]